MKKRTLTDAQKKILAKASHTAIANTFQTLYSDITNNEWLHNNVYSQNTTTTIEAHFKTNNINHIDLCKYIAASIPTHCMDGWGFLGRAIHCVVRGDTNTARHLAYYAELRAAMSLLASVGIGVLNNTHVVIDSNGQACEFPANHDGLGTHVFTWLALENWSKTQQAAGLIGEIIKVDSVSLRDWLDEFVATGNLINIASYWLSNWGLDLKILINDHDARNIVSYRPSHLTNVAYVNAHESSTFIFDLWKTLNPYSSTRFNLLDRYLLRKSLQAIDRDTPLLNAQGEQISYIDRISFMLSKFSLNKAIFDEYINFFTGNDFPDPIILREAENRQQFNNPRHHFEVLSRATLLLRIATGSCFQLINSASFSSTDLEFWWNNLGVERGLWNRRNKPGNNSGDIISLWDDVDIALQKIDMWKRRVNQPSYSGLINTQNTSLRVLESCERIGLWGLIP
jgi:hypothetical protein